eukprot:3265308-Prymnesium_polylepis.3
MPRCARGPGEGSATSLTALPLQYARTDGRARCVCRAGFLSAGTLDTRVVAFREQLLRTQPPGLDLVLRQYEVKWRGAQQQRNRYSGRISR